MLANVLPGLRDLRAPLVAGYLWLLAFYLAFRPLEPYESTTGIWRSLNALRHVVGSVGAGAAVSVLAYLLGSVSQELFGSDGVRNPIAAKLRHTLLMHDRLRKWIEKAVPGQRLKERVRHPYSRTEPLSQMRHGARGGQALGSAVNLRIEQIRSLLRDMGLGLAALAIAARDARLAVTSPAEMSRTLRPLAEIYAIESGLLGHREPPPDLDELNDTDEWDFVETIEAAIYSDAARELNLARTGLLGRETDLFSTIDRLQAEAEFREAVTIPLLGLAASLAWRATWWSACLPAICAVILALQGRRRIALATDSLLEALRIGRAKIPILDQLDDAVVRCRDLARSSQ